MNARQPRRREYFGKHFRKLTVGEFACTVSRATVPKEELPEHIHEEGHFILAIDAGYESRALDGFGRGVDLIYNPPQTVHRDCFFAPGGRFLSIAIPARSAPKSQAPIYLGSRESRSLAARALGLCVSGGGPNGILEDVILELIGTVDGNQSVTVDPTWVRRADELVDVMAIESDASVARLAAALKLHPVYLARAYKAARGHGPAKAMQDRRVRAATEMLARDISLAEVAAACGFADQSHLSRALKQWFGTAPSALRAAFA